MLSTFWAAQRPYYSAYGGNNFLLDCVPEFQAGEPGPVSYTHLRLLYARIGVAHCYKCGKPIKKQTIDQIVDRVCDLPEGTKIQVLAPVVRGRKGEYQKVLDGAKKSGYVRVRVDGQMYESVSYTHLDVYKRQQ